MLNQANGLTGSISRDIKGPLSPNSAQNETVKDVCPWIVGRFFIWSAGEISQPWTCMQCFYGRNISNKGTRAETTAVQVQPKTQRVGAKWQRSARSKNRGKDERKTQTDYHTQYRKWTTQRWNQSLWREKNKDRKCEVRRDRQGETLQKISQTRKSDNKGNKHENKLQIQNHNTGSKHGKAEFGSASAQRVFFNVSFKLI